tara:strand:- start:19 stop:729 length:711 start_codon:yes stop_codon:yes gene_type:complete
MSRIRTKNDFDFFEVSSAYQKTVRRGYLNALHWAYELYISGYGEYFWKRTHIIAMEDVGLADPDAITRIVALKQAYDYLHKKKDPHERLCIFQAVLYLVNAKKSRLVDWTKMKVVNRHALLCEGGVDPVTGIEEPALEIPDFALDCHTRRGKQAGKTVNDFFTDGSKLSNHEELPYERDFRDWAEKLHKLPKQVQEELRPPVGTKHPLMPDNATEIRFQSSDEEEKDQINGQKTLF